MPAKKKGQKGFVGWFRGMVNNTAVTPTTPKGTGKTSAPAKRIIGAASGKTFKTQVLATSKQSEWQDFNELRFPVDGGALLGDQDLLNIPKWNGNTFSTSSFYGSKGLPEGASAQWVSKVTAFSSEYDPESWCANCLVGPPRVFHQAQNYGDIPGAWTAPTGADGIEWVEWTVAKPVYPVAIKIYETYNCGAVCRIQGWHKKEWVTLWEWDGPPGRLRKVARIFEPELEFKDFATQKFRLEQDCGAVSGYNEIDCISVIGLDAKNKDKCVLARLPEIEIKFDSSLTTFYGTIKAHGQKPQLFRGFAEDIDMPPVVDWNIDLAQGRQHAIRSNATRDYSDEDEIYVDTDGTQPPIWELDLGATVPISEVLLLAEKGNEICSMRDLVVYVLPRNTKEITNLDEFVFKSDILNEGNVLEDPEQLTVSIAPPVMGSVVRVLKKTPASDDTVELALSNVVVHSFDVARGKQASSTGGQGLGPQACTDDGDDMFAHVEGAKDEAGRWTAPTLQVDLGEMCAVNSVIVETTSPAALASLHDVRVATFASAPPADLTDFTGATYISDPASPLVEVPADTKRRRRSSTRAPKSVKVAVDLGSYPVDARWIRLQGAVNTSALSTPPFIDFTFVRVFKAVEALDIPTGTAKSLDKGKAPEGTAARKRARSQGTFVPRRVHGVTVGGVVDDQHMELMTPSGIFSADLSDLQKALHEAVSNQDLGRCAGLLLSAESTVEKCGGDPSGSKGALLDARDTWQRTPLHVAAKRGNANITALLLSQGASPTAHDRLRNTPLHTAAAVLKAGDFKNAAEVAQMLLSSPEVGRALRTCDRQFLLNAMGETPWHLCARSDNVEVARMFTRHPSLCEEAVLGMRNANGRTAQDLAASAGMGRALEQAWRAAQARIVHINNPKDAFVTAVEKGDLKGALKARPMKNALWVDKVVAVSCPEEDEYSEELVEELLEEAQAMVGFPRIYHGEHNYHASSEAWCGQDFAEDGGDKAWVRFRIGRSLVPKKIEIYETYNPGNVTQVHAVDDDGPVLLWEGKVDNSLPAQARIFTPPLKEVHKEYAEFQVTMEGRGEGRTIDGQIDAVRVLADEDEGPNDTFGELQETALMLAAKKGRAAMVALLLSLQADPNIKDVVGFSPLHRAAMNNHFEVVRLLLSQTTVHRAHMADAAHGVNANGETLMHSCARAGSGEMIRLVATFPAFAGQVTRMNNQAQLPRDLCSAPVQEVFNDIAAAQGVDLLAEESFPFVSPVVCAVCLRAPPAGEEVTWTCDCQAPYCEECFQHLLTSCLHSGALPRCCNLDCEQLIPWEVVGELLPISNSLTLFSLVVNKQMEKTLPAAAQHQCGVCNRLTDKSEAYDAAVPRFQCQHCNVQLCVVCNNIFPFTPEELYTDTPQDDQIHGKCMGRYREARKWAVLRKVLDYSAERRCPRCHLGGLKDDACTHMSCCTSWCFVCGRGASDTKQRNLSDHGNCQQWQDDPTCCPMYIYPLAQKDPRVASVGCSNRDCQQDGGSCDQSTCTKQREGVASALLVTMRVRYALLKYCATVGVSAFRDLLDQYDYRTFVDQNFFNGAFPWDADDCDPLPKYYEFDPEECREFYKDREAWFDFDVPDFNDEGSCQAMFKKPTREGRDVPEDYSYWDDEEVYTDEEEW